MKIYLENSIDIRTQPIQLAELQDLIEFDKIHLLDVMEEIGIEKHQISPILTLRELLTAFDKEDILSWLLVNNEVAGYMWRERRTDHLFGAGMAIQRKFYGMGLIDYIIHLTEKIAKDNNLSVCKLAVIPANGRAVNAYMRHGYQITEYLKIYTGEGFPDRFRCILKKDLLATHPLKVPIHRCEISCTDWQKITTMISQGYVGVQFVNLSKDDLSENKIVFELFEH